MQDLCLCRVQCVAAGSRLLLRLLRTFLQASFSLEQILANTRSVGLHLGSRCSHLRTELTCLDVGCASKCKL